MSQSDSIKVLAGANALTQAVFRKAAQLSQESGTPLELDLRRYGCVSFIPDLLTVYAKKPSEQEFSDLPIMCYIARRDTPPIVGVLPFEEQCGLTQETWKDLLLAAEPVTAEYHAGAVSLLDGEKAVLPLGVLALAPTKARILFLTRIPDGIEPDERLLDVAFTLYETAWQHLHGEESVGCLKLMLTTSPNLQLLEVQLDAGSLLSPAEPDSIVFLARAGSDGAELMHFSQFMRRRDNPAEAQKKAPPEPRTPDDEAVLSLGRELDAVLDRLA
ncbi:MAG: hypothetical protein HDQ87_06930 [Clostridia bacterium]|nr:hypothetical protein [Clostridia bacterium]